VESKLLFVAVLVEDPPKCSKSVRDARPHDGAVEEARGELAPHRAPKQRLRRRRGRSRSGRSRVVGNNCSRVRPQRHGRRAAELRGCASSSQHRDGQHLRCAAGVGETSANTERRRRLAKNRASARRVGQASSAQRHRQAANITLPRTVKRASRREDDDTLTRRGKGARE
jgi:hypothetical protein